MTKLKELKDLFDANVLKEVKSDEITVYGYQYNYQANIIKSVSNYWFHKNEIEEILAPLNSESENNNRPGTIKESIEYITVHDTASSSKTADEYAHAKYVQNGGGGTSWHYSVGEKMSIHQIPDNEVAYHAGDSLMVRFELLDTGVNGINTNPIVDIKDGYYYLDNQKTNIKAPVVTFVKDGDKLVFASDGIKQTRKAPDGYNENELFRPLTKEDINDAGLRVDLIEGRYYMGPTYYNASFNYIANRGGNLNSIGIESMLNEGSNLIRTWHRLAKLVAHLLVENNLDLSRVKPHHFFSGKPCPMTMRNNGYYNYFMDCVKFEYLILTRYNDVQIKFIPLTNNIDDDGLIKIDITNDSCKYKIILIHNYNQLELEYETKIIK